MANKRDTAQAYRFASLRNASALLGTGAEAEGTLRRATTVSIASLMAAVLVGAGYGVYGILRPGNATSWKDGASLILVKGTGSRYVYLDGKLHPVLNYASARLILRNGTFHTVSVASSSLAGTPIGPAVGIPGAPDAVPDSGALVRQPWSVCSLPPHNVQGGGRPSVSVRVGRGGDGTPLASGDGLLVQAPDGTQYLLWNGTRLRVAATGALNAIGYAPAAVPVGAAWIDALPQGPDFAALAVPGRGGAGRAVGGQPTRIGEIVQTTGLAGATTYYVVLADGLALVTRLQAELMLADPAYPGAGGAPLQVAPDQASAAQQSASNPAEQTGFPATAPRPAAQDPAATEVCEQFQDSGGTTVAGTLSVATLSPGTVSGSTTPIPTDSSGTPLADEVDLAPGSGALVRDLPEPGVTTGTEYLVTEDGVKYPIAANDVLAALGLGGVTPVAVPHGVLAAIPTGPALDTAAATQADLPSGEVTASATP